MKNKRTNNRVLLISNSTLYWAAGISIMPQLRFVTFSEVRKQCFLFRTLFTIVMHTPTGAKNDLRNGPDSVVEHIFVFIHKKKDAFTPGLVPRRSCGDESQQYLFSSDEISFACNLIWQA